ncbi:hypothetical protein TNCV_529901 [Trichonephila clavipes]|nr:hypothetical protein TNCV_529901 [Trichonephila clavipes]
MALKIDRWPEDYENTPSEEKYSYQQIIRQKEIPALYEKDIDKVELHMDKASSHTSKPTAAYLAKKAGA